MNAIGWMLTYFLPLGLIAFGTVNQGDDGPWMVALFFFAPLALIGGLILSLRFRSLSKNWGWAVVHFLTLFLCIRILPDYWIKVTLSGDHIAAGFSSDYIGVFSAAHWHFWWAPLMTSLSVFVLLLVGFTIYQTRAQQVVALNR